MNTAYKYAEISDKQRSHITEQKSRVFGGVEYVLYDGKPVLALCGTVANNAHTIAHWLNGEEYTKRLQECAEEMYKEE